MSKKTIGYLLLSCFIFINHIYANSMQNAESAYIEDVVRSSTYNNMPCNQNFNCTSSLTRKIYIANNFMPLWDNGRSISSMSKNFLKVIRNSYQDGLNPEDYHLNTINQMIENLDKNQYSNESELIILASDLDLTLSDALLLYASDMAYGKVNNTVFYPRWKITKRSIELVPLLLNALNDDNLKATLNSLTPQNTEYTKLKQQLAIYQKIAAAGGWQPIPNGPALSLGNTGERVLILQHRLLATGELDELTNNDKKNFNEKVKQAVIAFQNSHGITADGNIGKTTLQALNVPVTDRILQIELNMDRLRWLPSNLGSRYILVNIPNYSLVVVQDNQVVLSMPVIVGKSGLQSCVLSSKITSFDINPYWYVPNSIAVKEYLPDIKRNPNFLADNDMRLFDKKNNQEVNPDNINWTKIEPNNFNYLIRQEPGESNALGDLKFYFPNDCGIYLHDTPSKELFQHKRRAFSHGCIRIGNPLGLASYLVQKQDSWNESAITEIIQSGKHKTVTLKDPIAIYITYATVWVDQDGSLQFRNDIYHIDNVPYPVYIPNVDKSWW